METNESFLQTVLEFLKKEILSDLHVAMPGRIEAYDPETGLADVQPMLTRKTGAGEILPAPMLRDVPVLLQSVGYSVAAGTPCTLLFMDFCMDGWLQSGQPVLPPSPRQHDFPDAIALAGYASAFPD